MLILLVH